MKRCFLQWFLLTLAYAVGGFFAFRFGLPQAIWHGDSTHLTAVIGVVSLAAVIYLGFAAWEFDADGPWKDIRYHSRTARAEAAATLGRTAAFLITLIGLLGTAIGLMLQVKAMASVDVNSSQSVLAFVSAIGGALGTALYATSCGIVGCIGITLLTSNIEYALDREAR
jgi:hypothetical protein